MYSINKKKFLFNTTYTQTNLSNSWFKNMKKNNNNIKLDKKIILTTSDFFLTMTGGADSN